MDNRPPEYQSLGSEIPIWEDRFTFYTNKGYPFAPIERLAELRGDEPVPSPIYESWEELYGANHAYLANDLVAFAKTYDSNREKQEVLIIAAFKVADTLDPRPNGSYYSTGRVVNNVFWLHFNQLQFGRCADLTRLFRYCSEKESKQMRAALADPGGYGAFSWLRK